MCSIPVVQPDLDHACWAASRSTTSRLWGLVPHDRGYRLVDTTAVRSPDSLIGFHAPDHWAGLVLASTGTMRRTDGDSKGERVRVGYALDRDGRSVSTIATLDGRRVLQPDHAAVGHVPDVAHRILGMATPPETCSPLPLLICAWLEEVLDLATDPEMSGWTDDWLAVADLHPAADLTAERTPRELAAALAEPGVVPTWEGVRSAAIRAGLGIGGFEPDEVGWLDAPSLARFVLAGLPSLWDLLAAVLDSVPPPVARAIAQCLFGEPQEAGT
jgi:hypothetical protein